jgi:hypothetical protein
MADLVRRTRGVAADMVFFDLAHELVARGVLRALGRYGTLPPHTISSGCLYG